MRRGKYKSEKKEKKIKREKGCARAHFTSAGPLTRAAQLILRACRYSNRWGPWADALSLVWLLRGAHRAASQRPRAAVFPAQRPPPRMSCIQPLASKPFSRQYPTYPTSIGPTASPLSLRSSRHQIFEPFTVVPWVVHRRGESSTDALRTGARVSTHHPSVRLIL
jgi:hypothetical protein